MKSEQEIRDELKLLLERRPDGWVDAYVALRWVLGDDAVRVRGKIGILSHGENTLSSKI